MPWTFAHPAAVLPLQRWARTPSSFAALMIGSMVPDAGYFVFRFEGSAFAHSPLGSVTLCPLAGMLLLLLGCALRRPLCYLLPQPHRAALLSLANAPLQWDWPKIGLVLACLIVGAWTHLLWDSFTHVDRWFVERIPGLQQPVLYVHGHLLYGYSLLQYASSLLGAALLLRAYALWIRKVSGATALQWFTPTDAWRYGCIAASMVVAAALALLWSFNVASRADGLFDLRVFVVRWVVSTTSLFGAAFVGMAMICYWRRTEERSSAL